MKTQNKFLPFLNPVNWVKAYRFHKNNARYDKSSYDLELYLYSQILKNDMLHYGYFEDPSIQPEDISFKDLESAQIRYAEKIAAEVSKEGKVLDAGCGTGGLSGILLRNGVNAEALTPDRNQVSYINRKYPELTCHHTKFENFDQEGTYQTIIHSESLQYIRLEEAFQQVNRLMPDSGKWIVVDYFRTRKDARHPSGHLLDDFLQLAEKNNWKISKQEDITDNALPTLRFINMFAERFLIPLRHFAYEKLRYKKAWLYFLSSNIRESVNAKIDKELKAVDPELFGKEKRYLFFVLEK